MRGRRAPRSGERRSRCRSRAAIHPARCSAEERPTRVGRPIDRIKRSADRSGGRDRSWQETRGEPFRSADGHSAATQETVRRRLRQARDRPRRLSSAIPPKGFAGRVRSGSPAQARHRRSAPASRSVTSTISRGKGEGPRNAMQDRRARAEHDSAKLGKRQHIRGRIANHPRPNENPQTRRRRGRAATHTKRLRAAGTAPTHTGKGSQNRPIRPSGCREHGAQADVADEVEGESEPQGGDDDEAEFHAKTVIVRRRLGSQERMKRRTNRASGRNSEGRSKRRS